MGNYSTNVAALRYNMLVYLRMESGAMDICKGDVLNMKKTHPCGSDKMLVLRSGMDFKLRCLGCGHEFMIPRLKAEKNVKSVDVSGRESAAKN